MFISKSEAYDIAYPSPVNTASKLTTAHHNQCEVRGRIAILTLASTIVINVFAAIPRRQLYLPPLTSSPQRCRSPRKPTIKSSGHANFHIFSIKILAFLPGPHDSLIAGRRENSTRSRLHSCAGDCTAEEDEERERERERNEEKTSQIQLVST